MKHQPLFYLLAIATTLLLYTCNPDCTTYTVVEATIEPDIRFPGDEILVKTNPSDFLRNRELFMAKSAADGGGVVQMVSSFDLEAGGRIALLDSEFPDVGIQQIYVEDNDCGGLISLESVNLVDESFSNLNPSLFVIPSPSIIIIPPPPIPAPTNIVNTWFSPDDPRYCIWFDPQVDTMFNIYGMDSCFVEKTTLRPGNIAEGSGTRELRCGGTDADNDHNNPITGFINHATGQVSFTVNREAKGLGTEKFVGQLVEPDNLPEAYQTGGRCAANADSRPTTMMVVKSELTGRILVLYREGPADFVENFCD